MEHLITGGTVAVILLALGVGNLLALDWLVKFTKGESK